MGRSPGFMPKPVKRPSLMFDIVILGLLRFDSADHARLLQSIWGTLSGRSPVKYLKIARRRTLLRPDRYAHCSPHRK